MKPSRRLLATAQIFAENPGMSVGKAMRAGNYAETTSHTPGMVNINPAMLLKLHAEQTGVTPRDILLTPAMKLLQSVRKDLDDPKIVLTMREKLNIAAGLMELHAKHAVELERNPTEVSHEDKMRYKIATIKKIATAIAYTLKFPEKANHRLNQLAILMNMYLSKLYEKK